LGRRLGQHFLARQSILERIAEAVCPEPTPLVVEIGPGKGALTSHLLSRCERVIAVEIDPVLVQYLRAKFRAEPRLEIVERDILKTDLSGWGLLAAAGNLPYYITSPIVEKTLSVGSALLSRAVFLVQKEVAERLIASPGSRAYGYLSVQTRLYSTPELLFTVPAAAFHPAPKVDSAVVRLTPHPVSPAGDAKALLRFVSQCFQHKRKTIRNNLFPAYDKALLDALPETARRAEQLTLEEFAALREKLDAAG
jgi:16S rRNA (adenine1518-N6/adenine1519-N6)-dimethyltransferase